MYRRSWILGAALAACAAGAAHAQTVTLFDNGVANGLGPVGLATGLGTGPIAGYAVSQRPDPQLNNAGTADTVVGGYGMQFGVNALADRFTVPVGQTWTINTVRVFAYVSDAQGTYTVPPVSPLTDIAVSILSAAPTSGTFPYAAGPNTLSSVHRFVGDPLFSSRFTGIWRTPADNTTSTARPIFAATLGLPGELTLPAGDYWFAFSGRGTQPVSQHNIFAAPLTRRGTGTTSYPVGNGRQFFGSNWNPAVSGNPSRQVAFPFQLLHVTAPEPASALLLAPGLLLLALRRRRS